MGRVKPTDISLLHSLSRPVPLPDGRVVVADAHPDLEENRSLSTLLVVGTDGSRRPLTTGTRDSAPLLTPDGRTLLFTRGTQDDKGRPTGAQLFAMPVDGGEPRQLTDHRLGVHGAVVSPDGRSVAYLAAVPEPGRYGDDEKTGPDAEAPRRITTLTFQRDGEGYLLDKPAQLFLLELPDPAAPLDAPRPRARQLTRDPLGVGDPAFTPDGRSIVVARSPEVDALGGDLVVLAVPASAQGGGDRDGDRDDDHDDVTATVERVLAEGLGDAGQPLVVGETVWFLGMEFSGVDAVGRTVGLFSVPLHGGEVTRHTDEATVHLAGQPLVADGDDLLAVVLRRGDELLVRLRPGPVPLTLDELTVLVPGPAAVTGFALGEGPDGQRVVHAVRADPTSKGELVRLPATGGEIEQRTDLGAALVEAGLRPPTEITGSAVDGYPVHGWLFTPPGDGPFPLLLNVHGGPHAAYGPSLFDEAQVYVSAGYAVLMGNPRGSAGYGHDHGRAVVHAMGTVDVTDVLGLLDTALDHPEHGRLLDRDRVGVMGGSYGGFMTSWLASHASDRFVAGISERAVNAWDSFTGSSDIGHFFTEAYVSAERDEQWASSPLAHADDISIPLLIIHSEQDWRCPVEQARRLYVALRQRGAETELLLFPGEGHELSRSGRPRHRVQRFEAILDWWQRHLPVGADASG